MSMMADDARKRRRRWMWGCTGGCLGFMLATFLLMVILMRVFVVRPRPVVPPETFVTPKTQAFVFATVRADDPLMLAVLRAMVTAHAENAVKTKSGEPANPEFLLDVARRAAPLQLVIILEMGEQALVPDLAVSVHSYSPLVLALIRAGVVGSEEGTERNPEEYGGALLYTTASGTTVLFRGNNLGIIRASGTGRLWADALAEQRSLEKRAGAEAVPVPELPARDELVRAHDRLDGADPVRFAAVNTGPEAKWLLSVLPEGPVRDALAAAGLGSRIVVSIAGQIESLGADSGGLTLFVECGDAASAEKLRAGIAEVAAAQAGGAVLRDVAVRVQDEKVVVVSAIIDGLPDKAVALGRYLEERGKRAASPVPAPTPPSP